jgi:Ribbon-helix-helix protein, copG family
MAADNRMINLWVPPEMADQLTEDARAHGWSRAELLRRLAARHLAGTKEQNRG